MLNRAKVHRIKSYLKYCGNNTFIHPTCHIILPQNLEIGDNTSISSFTTIYATYGVRIGANCLISSNCGISSYNHVTNSSNRYIDHPDDYKYSKSVIVSDNVWIGMNVCILPGIKIGENSIIGAGSVVTKDVPSNQLWVGNPASLLKILDI